VVVITIRRVLEVSLPATGPAKLAYRPWTGLTRPGPRPPYHPARC
jgi:hypothetical protein